jgi:hypothetical protein
MENAMRDNPVHTESNGQTRLAYILGVPLAENAVRQWPQMQVVFIESSFETWRSENSMWKSFVLELHGE